MQPLQVKRDRTQNGNKLVTQRIRCSILLASIERLDGTTTTGQRNSTDTLVKALLPNDDELKKAVRQSMVRIYNTTEQVAGHVSQTQGPAVSWSSTEELQKLLSGPLCWDNRAGRKDNEVIYQGLSDSLRKCKLYVVWYNNSKDLFCHRNQVSNKPRLYSK